MPRILSLSLLALLALVPGAWAGGLFTCCNWGIHCIEPPPPDCCDCGPPHHHGHCSAHKSEHARKLIEELCQGNCCCIRIKAAEKLGCCLHADWCCDPEVLDALVRALECDTCWEVRRAAAWSIAMQNARTPYAVMALYLASKCDPHYLVRDRSRDALDILTVCHYDCFRKIYDSVDASTKTIKPYYKPTTGQCVHLEESCGCWVVHVTKVEAKKEEKPEPCLIPITLVEHEHHCDAPESVKVLDAHTGKALTAEDQATTTGTSSGATSGGSSGTTEAGSARPSFPSGVEPPSTSGGTKPTPTNR